MLQFFGVKQTAAIRSKFGFFKKGFTSKSGARVLPPFKVERFWGWDASDISLSSSECEPLRLDQLLSFASASEREKWEKTSLGYPLQMGALELRKLVVDRLLTRGDLTNKLNVNKPEVTIVVPQEGIYLAMRALLAPGDTCIVTKPCYQSLESVAWSIGCNITPWHVRTGLNCKNSGEVVWRFDVDELSYLLEKNPHTKMVICNFPHNPTGAVPLPEEFIEIGRICEKHNTWLFVDEMYSGLEHNGTRTLPSACQVMSSKGISMGGVSKTFGMPGLRIGWVASHNNRLTERIRELKDYTTVCNSSTSEALAIIALKYAVEIEGLCKMHTSKGLEDLSGFVSQNANVLEWNRPLGGTFSLVKLKSMEGKVASYCDSLIKEHGIMLLPGSLFELENDSFVRICYGSKGVGERLQLWKEASPDVFNG